MNYVKTITAVLACVSVLVFLLALGAFTTQGVSPDGTRVTFTTQGVSPDGTRVTFTSPDTRDQSISPDSGTLTW